MSCSWCEVKALYVEPRATRKIRAAGLIWDRGRVARYKKVVSIGICSVVVAIMRMYTLTLIVRLEGQGTERATWSVSVSGKLVGHA